MRFIFLFLLVFLAIMAIPDLRAYTTTESAKLVNFSRPNADFTGPFDLLAYVLEKNDPAATRASYYEWTEGRHDPVNCRDGPHKRNLCCATLLGLVDDSGRAGAATEREDAVNGEPLDWWLDRINLLIDMMGDVDLGGAIDAGLLCVRRCRRWRLRRGIGWLIRPRPSTTTSSPSLPRWWRISGRP